MVYTGLNENEIAKITKILDDYKVIYQVSVHQEALEKVNALSDEEMNKFRKQSKRSGQALMQIEIEIEEFKKIPPAMKDRLHALGVYEDVESPFSEEDFATMAEDKPREKKIDPYAKIKSVAMILAMVLFIFLMLVKRKILSF